MDKPVYYLYISRMINENWNVRIIRAHKTFCAPDWHWVNLPGQWDGYLLWVILKGSGRIITETRRYELFAGQCFHLRMSEAIEGRHDPHDRLLVPWLHYEYVDADGRIISPGRVREQRVLGNPAFVTELLDRAISGFLEQRATVANHWLKAALLEIRKQDMLPARKGPALEYARRIGRLCEMIRENPGLSLRVEDMARQLYCSPDHFTRIFKQVKGLSPRAFITRCRIESAKSLLRFSSHPIGRIADMLGYNDIYHFSKQFKSQAGVSPSDFRSGT